MRRRGDLDLGATDASIIGLAERLATDLVITLDRRRFEAVRTPGGRPFDLPPETRRTDETAAPYGSSQG